MPEDLTPEERRVLSIIGRRGGLKTGRKGFAAMTPERRKEIQSNGVAARKTIAKRKARKKK